MNVELINAIVAKHRAFAIAAREHIHSHPELSDKEIDTSAYICKCLEEADVEYRRVPGMTGIVAIIRGAQNGPTIALRADMDALPIQEDSNKSYRSQNIGVMHACGHDVHTAILLGTARALNNVREHLEGNVKLFFQPAEEANGGAKRMVAAGCMKDPDVTRVFGLHVDAAIPCGTLRTKAGAFNASSDTFDVTFTGKKAHGADPEKGADAILAACSAVVSLQSVVSRRVSPHDSVVLTVGKIAGGDARNVIADKATLSIMLRTTDAGARRRACDALCSILNGTSVMHGVELQIEHQSGYDSMSNDVECVEQIHRVADKVLGEGAYSTVMHPFMGCEDFCYFCTDVPGAFYQLGSKNEALGITAPTHSSKYDADPETVAIGMRMQIGLVFDSIGTKAVR